MVDTVHRGWVGTVDPDHGSGPIQQPWAAQLGHGTAQSRPAERWCWAARGKWQRRPATQGAVAHGMGGGKGGEKEKRREAAHREARRRRERPAEGDGGAPREGDADGGPMASGEDGRATEKRCDLGEMAEGLGFEEEAHGDVNRQPKTREDGGCSPRAERTEFRQRLEPAEGWPRGCAVWRSRRRR